MLELALVTSLESVKIAADMEASSMIGDLKIKVMSSGENRFDASPECHSRIYRAARITVTIHLGLELSMKTNEKVMATGSGQAVGGGSGKQSV